MKKIISILVSIQLAFMPILFAVETLVEIDGEMLSYDLSKEELSTYKTFKKALYENVNILANQEINIVTGNGLPKEIQVIDIISNTIVKRVSIVPILGLDNKLEIEVSFENKNLNFNLTELATAFNQYKSKTLDSFFKDASQNKEKVSIDEFENEYKLREENLVKKYMENISFLTAHRLEADDISKFKTLDNNSKTRGYAHGWAENNIIRNTLEDKIAQSTVRAAWAFAAGIGMLLLSTGGAEIIANTETVRFLLIAATMTAVKVSGGILGVGLGAVYLSDSKKLKQKKDVDYDNINKILNSKSFSCKRFLAI